MNPIVKSIPNTITCLNLLSGCLAITMTFKAFEPVGGGLFGWQWAAIFIFSAAVFDFLDGFSARLLKAYSEIGKELDSLSDLVSFGVAPGLLLFNVLQTEYLTYSWLPYIAFMIPVFGGLRLARFNVEDAGSTTFRGLPIPANALFWIGFVAWVWEYAIPDVISTTIAVLLMSLSMVSDISLFSLKFKNLSFKANWRRYFIIVATIVLVSLLGISGFMWAILLYMLFSFKSTPKAAK